MTSTAKRPAQPADTFQREVASRLTELPTLADELGEWGAAHGAGPTTVQAVLLVFDELFSNIVIHGYGRSPGGRIGVEARLDDARLVVTLTDHAPAFDPLTVPPPPTDLPLEQRAPGGLGLVLVRKLADTFEYQRLAAAGPAPRNEVRFSKRLEPATGAG